MKTAWQEDVRRRLDAIGMSKKDLARKINAAQSSVQDVPVSRAARHSSLVPDIHAAIGWDPPPDPQSPPQPSAAAIELAHLFDRLPEEVRRKLRDDAEFYVRLALEKSV